MRWIPKSWNDALSVPVIVLLPLMLVFVYANGIPLPEIVIGALVAGWTLAVQFYYRKKESEV